MLALKAQHYTPERWERELGHRPTPEFIEQLYDIQEHYDIAPTSAFLLDTLLANVEEVAGYILDRTWTLVCLAERCLFSSEHPVVFVNPVANPMGYGVATAEKLYLPLSPTRALVMSLPWSDWPERIVVRHRGVGAATELGRPGAADQRAAPDASRRRKAHPLPGAHDFAAVAAWPGDEEPVYLQYLARRPSRPICATAEG